MDVHRCRFVPFVPQSINALAFSHPSNPKQVTPPDLRLAIGRANGDIELWNPLGGDWFQEKILHGSSGRTIEQLAWTQDLIVEENENAGASVETGALRLFSSGGSSSLTEWDLARGVPKRHAQGNFGDIWCFASQPQWNSTPRSKGSPTQAATAPSQRLAAGCSDGTVILFTTSDDDLQYERVVTQPPNKKSRVISIAWRDRNTLVIGYEASKIRIFDISKRQVVRDLSLGKPADGTNCVVWTVTCLADGTILSGDSSGELKIWDARNFSLIQRLKGHEADVLDITASEDGDIIYSCGVDRRTVAYRPTIVRAGRQGRRWQQFTHRRHHQHDVKVISSYQSKDLSVAVSGGMDAVPVVTALRGRNSEYHRTLSHLPQKPQMSVSAKARLLLTWWSKSLYLWSIPDVLPRNLSFEPSVMDGDNHRLLMQLQLSDDEDITSAEICDSGGMVMAATNSSVKLFQLRHCTSSHLREIRTRQIELPASMRCFGATDVGFSPDEKWLYAIRSSNVITLVKILRSESPKDKPRIQQRVIKLKRSALDVPKHLGNGIREYLRTIHSVAFSSDSRILAVGDLAGVINVWVLEGHENLENERNEEEVESAKSSDTSDSDSDSDSDDETDSTVIHGQKWIKPPNGSQLPILDTAIARLAFKPASTASVKNDQGDQNIGLHPTRHTPHPVSHQLPSSFSAHLLAITATHHLHEFDVLSCRLGDWSRRNPPSIFPSDFKRIKDRIMGSWWDCNPSRGYQRLWMYGSTWLYMLDLAQDLRAMPSTKASTIDRRGAHEVEDTAVQKIYLTQNGHGNSKGKRKRKRGTEIGDGMRTSTEESKGKNRANSTGLMSPVSNDEEDEQVNSLAFMRRDQDHHTRPSKVEEEDVVSPISWNTFRYRSILGAASLGARNQSRDDNRLPSDHPEIVIVERPMYDVVEMIPRFAGAQDWD